MDCGEGGKKRGKAINHGNAPFLPEPEQDKHCNGHRQKGLLAKQGAGSQYAGRKTAPKARKPQGGRRKQDAVNSMPGHVGETVHAKDKAAGCQKRERQADLPQVEHFAQGQGAKPGRCEHGDDKTGLSRKYLPFFGRQPEPEGMPVKWQGRLDIEKIPIGNLAFKYSPGIGVKIAKVRGIHSIGGIKHQIGQGHKNCREFCSRKFGKSHKAVLFGKLAAIVFAYLAVMSGKTKCAEICLLAHFTLGE